MKLHETACALAATAVGVDVEFTRVETDTRKLTPGCLFVALRGENFDGHAFAAKALEQGAAAVMVAKDAELAVAPAIIVDDTRIALGKLAAWHRERQPARLVAITGSNGKTTVKEMLAAICAAEAGSEAVLATAGNYNNDIGMPLTLLNLLPTHRYAVIEMGMNHSGEIDYLTRLARPEVALVNNALRAHLQGLGSVEAIAHAKGEIYAGLKPEGIAIINADDPHAGLWRELTRQHTVLSFGATGHADVRIVAAAETSNTSNTSNTSTTPNNLLVLDTPKGRIETTLQVPGRHNQHNAAAAATAALALGITPATISAGLAGYTGTKGRLQTHTCLFGATLIDDTYNANPDSVLAAIQVLAARSGTRILVLGDMGELGANALALHREVGEKAKAACIDRLFCLGELSCETAKGFGQGAMHFERIEELLAELEQALGKDVTVLVKGSRFMQMERVVKSFTGMRNHPDATLPPGGMHCQPQGGPTEDKTCS